MMAKEEQRKEGQKRNIWLDGIMGVVTGDALGCPVEFKTRAELDEDPVTGMQAYGTFNMPTGSWTDDSSMTLATLDSILEREKLNFPDVMYRFALWLAKGEYTPFGEAFDVGGGTMDAITRYMRMKEPNINKCGGISPENNGNGSLMRIMPACLYLYQRYHVEEDDTTAIWAIHKMSGLTHNHLRAKIACGLYYFMVCQILDAKKRIDAGNRTMDAMAEATDSNLMSVLQKGLEQGFVIIPVRRSRLSGYQETSSPAKREPHRFFIVRRSRQGCYPYRSVGYQCLLRQRWIQSIDFSHGDVPIQVEALNRDLV